MSDGRDHLGRPVFGRYGLGAGDPRMRDLGEPVNRGVEILYDYTPLLERHDPNVHIPRNDVYGDGGILGRRDIDPRRMGAQVLPPGRDARSAPQPPPMAGMNKVSREGNPDVYATSPDAKFRGVQVLGVGSAQSSGGVSDALAALKDRADQQDQRFAELERQGDKNAAGIIKVRFWPSD